MKIISVLDYLENTVSLYGNKISVIEENSYHSFIDLLKDSRKIAANIIKFLPVSEDYSPLPIMIFMEKSYLHIAAMYSILYSGNFYVPLDTDMPLERINLIFESLHTNLIITDLKGKKKLLDLGYTGTLFIIEDLLSNENSNIETLDSIREKICDVDLMYIIFTSGSTGTPKGVAVSHRAMLDYLSALVSVIPFSCDDIWGNQAPFFTDFSFRDIFTSMVTGASICIIPKNYFLTPERLLNFLNYHKVTIIAWVPAAYNIICRFDGLSHIHPQSITKFLFVGENMPIYVYNYWRKFYPDALWLQLYGPTETVGVSHYYFIKEKYYDIGEIIPIGKPFPNTRSILLDENNQIISKNRIGEKGIIHTGGTCLSNGYYNDEEKTSNSFVMVEWSEGNWQKMYRTGDIAYYDNNGDLVFVSRSDYQIKYMGRRIELGEIEAAVYACGNVNQCCCLYDNTKHIIILYYSGEADEHWLYDNLQKRIPKYMIPTKYYKMSSLPLLPNGKINRKQLFEIKNN